VNAARFDLVTFDSPATDALARFWSAAAGLHEVEREDVDRWIVLADAGGVRRIGIQRGAVRPGSIHLDLACAPEAFGSELDRLIALGAHAVGEPRVEPYGSIANLADPDGNLFDLCAYS
jgi:predicted enzyme related to lactoylglutathione lyase